MNNFHIYEEVGRGKYSVVYKVLNIELLYKYEYIYLHFVFVYTIIMTNIIKTNNVIGKKEEDYRLCGSQVS